MPFRPLQPIQQPGASTGFKPMSPATPMTTPTAKTGGFRALQGPKPTPQAPVEPQGTKGVGGFFLGAGKKALETVQGLGNLAARGVYGLERPILNPISKALSGKEMPTTGEFARQASEIVPAEKLQRHGFAEKAGGTTVDIATTLLQPEIGAESLASRVLARGAEGALYNAAQTAGSGGTGEDITKSAAIGAGTNIVAAPLVGKLFGKGTRTAEQASKDALKLIEPVMTKAEREAASAAGRGTKKGFLGKVEYEPTKITKDAAEIVKDVVNPKKTFTENINAVRSEIAKEAEALKGQIKTVDKPYNVSELSSKLSNVEEPISIKGTAFEKQIKAVKKAAMKIAESKDKTTSGLLDARKAFDDLVEKEYPNLWDKENAPMRNAITAIRDEMNNFIDKNLPNNVSFKDSLKKQRLMYHAIENMGPKAGEEAGTTAVGRFMQRNPKTSKALRYGGSAVAGGLGGEVFRQVLH